MKREQGMMARLLSIVLIALVSLSISGAAGFSQVKANKDGAPDYEVWEADAERAEDVLAARRASTESLEVMRSQLSAWRELFSRRQNVNSKRIETLQKQIKALGPEPEGTEREDLQIANRRSELEKELKKLTAPQRRAEEAFNQSMGLITQLDEIVRERAANRILQHTPTPANPVLWPEVPKSLIALGQKLSAEVQDRLDTRAQSTRFSDQLPLVLLLVIVGLVLITQGGAWVDKGLSRLRASRHSSRARVRVGVFLFSLISLALPVLGVLAFFKAAEQSQTMGLVANSLLDLVAEGIVIAFTARWLGRQIAPPFYPPYPILKLGDAKLRKLRVLINLSGVIFVLGWAIAALRKDDLLSDEAASVLNMPVVIVGGVLLYRLARLLVYGTASASEDDADHSEPAQSSAAATILLDTPSAMILRNLRRALLAVSVLAPTLYLLGYTFAGSTLLASSFLTLALGAVVVILQRFVRDFYATVRGNEDSKDGLVPVLIGFALAVASMPFLALIWGARPSDIKEAWTLVSNGLQIGETRISPVDFLWFVVVFALGFALTRLLQRALKSQILPKTNIDTGGQNAITVGTGYVGIFLSALIAITSAGIDLSAFAIVAGALSVGIGFGLQNIVSNFVSGIILLIERPISEGDWIEVGDNMGVVRRISVRSTRIETFDRTDVIVPNADLIAGTVTNWTKGNLTGRIILNIGVAYGSDTRRVEEILREIVEAHPMVILNPAPLVLFVNFGADSLDFEIRAILRDVNYSLGTRSALNHEIAKRFAEEGIEIPFAQRDVWLRNPETLQSSASGSDLG